MAIKSCTSCGYVCESLATRCVDCGRAFPSTAPKTTPIVEEIITPPAVETSQPDFSLVEEVFAKVDRLVTQLHESKQQQDTTIQVLQERIRRLEESLAVSLVPPVVQSPDIHFHFPEEVTFKKTEVPRVKTVERDEQGLITHVVEKDITE